MTAAGLIPPGATAAEAQEAVLALLNAGMLSPQETLDLTYCWQLFARPEQLPPVGDWRTWLILGGRGSGKTRPGAEWTRDFVMTHPGCRVALIGPTASDCRQVMVEGESGLLAVFPPHERPLYKPSVREIRFRNMSVAFTYSAEEPERLRGPQHHACWCDEIAAYPDAQALWDLLIPGLRLGADPRRVCTTTPKPTAFLHKLIADAGTVVSRMRTRDNRANLPASTLAELDRLYAGTRIGRQELEGELLDEAEGALWNRAQIDKLRVAEAPELRRVVVAIDPSTTAGPDSDECGIVACGLGIDGHGYVLADKSGVFPPAEWAHRAVSLFDAVAGDRIIAETNNGGDLVESVIRTVRPQAPYQKVTASRGKVARAEPIAALYEQGRIHHVGGFRQLEDEQVNFVPGALTKSPNRVDALVWAFSFLMGKPPKEGRALWLG